MDPQASPLTETRITGAAGAVSMPSSLAAYQTWLASDDTGARAVRLLMADYQVDAVRSIAEFAFRSGYLGGSEAALDRLTSSVTKSFDTLLGAAK